MAPRTKKQAITTKKQTTPAGKTKTPRKAKNTAPTTEEILTEEIIELPAWEGSKKSGIFERFGIPKRASEERITEEEKEELPTKKIESIAEQEVISKLEEEKPLTEEEKVEKVDRALSNEEKKQLKKEDLEPVMHLINAIESLGLEEFIEYIRSPWRLLWPNFVAGVARGFGALVGATIVVALVIWGLTQLVGIPLIGRYFEPLANTVQEELQKYIESTNYNDHFIAIEQGLDTINTTLGGGNNTQSGTGSR